MKRGQVEEKDNQLILGIDLGTSRTAIRSNRGARAVFASIVGYPKDIMGMKLLKKEKLVGDEVFEKRSYLDSYYPLESGVIKETSESDLETAKDLIEYAVNLANPAEDDEIHAVIGVPARASATSKETLLKLANEMMNVILVVSEPFMVAYGMDKLERAIIVDIGAGTTDICALKGIIPIAEDHVTLPKAGDYVDKALIALLLEKHPEIQMTKQLAKSIKEKHSFVGEIKESAMVTFRENGKPKAYDVAKEIKAACEVLITPIVEQIENLLVRYDPDDQEDALKNIYLAGNGSKIKGLDKAIETALKDYGEINVICIQDPDYAGCNGALKLAMDLPVSHWNQIGDVIGL
ncbi:MAG: rod shape-determining protein [SAR324 cluster bacterium]|nr:rod shape-determining protein [SAR324 cluster bacterium]